MDTKEGNVLEEMKNREEYSGEFQKIEFLSDAVKNMDLTDGKSGTIVISSEKTEEELNIFQQDLSRIHLTEKPDKKYRASREKLRISHTLHILSGISYEILPSDDHFIL